MRILDRVVLFIGFTGCILLLVLLSVREFQPIYTIAVSIGIGALVVYLLICTRIRNGGLMELPQIRMALPVATVLLSGAAITWMLRPDLHVKPMGYYVLVALASGALFLVAATTKKRVEQVAVLVIACLIGIAHVWTENLLFPGLLGIDAWAHYWTATVVLDQAGTTYPPLTLLNMGGSYSLFHVYLRWIMSITSMDYKTASLVFWATPQIVGNIVLVFLIGRALVSTRTGLVASVMVASANWVVFFGGWVIPNGIGATLGLLVAFCFILAYKSRKTWIALLVIPIIPIALLTHIIVTIWVLGIIGVFSIGLLVKRSPAVAVLAIALIAVFTWYNLSYMHFAVSPVLAAKLDPSAGLTYATGNALAIIVPNPVANPTPGSPAPEPQEAPNFLKGNTAELLVNSSGMLLYVALGMIGVMIQLRRQTLNRSWVLLCAGVTLIGFVPQVFGFSVIEHRWYYLSEVVLSIPLAILLTRLPNMSTTKVLEGHRTTYRVRLGGLVATGLLVALVVFLSTIGLPSNTTNRTLSENQIVRYSFTAEEMAGAGMLEEYHVSSVGTDPLYSIYLRYGIDYPGEIQWVDKEIVCGDFSRCPSEALLLRDSLHREPIGYGSGTIYQLQFDPVQLAIAQGYKDVCSNGSIHLLVRGSK